MIPEGAGWQYLRSRALDTVPVGTKVHHTNAMPFHEWRERGAFTVKTCNKKNIVLESAGSEVGAAFLSDSELLADHAAEHAAQVYGAVMLDGWSSPAWNVVTVYYWSFFSALAITRLIGKSAVFLDRASLAELSTLAGATEQPGAGALYMELLPYGTATLRSISLRPSKVQFHDAVWTAANWLVSNVVANSNRQANVIEHHFWSLIKRPADVFGSNWPSMLRNAVNYKPGCGYREVTRRTGIDMAAHLRSATPTDVESLTDRFEQTLNGMPRELKPSDDIRLFSRLLGLYALALSAIFERLHTEVVERQGGDRRWRDLRRRFRQNRYSVAHGVWPFSP